MKLTSLSLEELDEGSRASLCQHCGATIPEHRNDRFCCSGCRAVYRLLRDSDLAQYYRIRDEAGAFRQPTSVRPLSEKLSAAHPFQYLDEPTFRTELGISLTRPAVQFYLEGVHCTACLWLIEKLPELLPNEVATARLSLQSSIVDLTLTQNGSISKVADYLDQLGYRPHPVFSPSQKSDLSSNESRVFLTRVAVAGALTGNIMLFAFAIYSGASGLIKEYFDWITLGLATPVFSYCAIPLYQNAWAAARNKRWSVDIPIVIALVAGFITSLISVMRGGDQNYLDSLSGLIFLLLGSRYFLMRLRTNAFEGMQISQSFHPIKVLRNDHEYVWVKELKVGDRIEIPPGFRIPVDGVVIRGNSQIDESIISGESVLRPVDVHEDVYAGSLNASAMLWIRVAAVGDLTRIGKITQEIQTFQLNQNDSIRIAERVAKLFTLSVLAWSTIVLGYFLFFQSALQAGFERVLSILIVSCPCAFALATPLAMVRAFQILLKRGVYLKDPNDIEKLLAIKQVAFDKTGTLTRGASEVQHVSWMAGVTLQDQQLYLSIVRALEADSKHPIGRALLRYVDEYLVAGQSVEEVKGVEIVGNGVEGMWNGQKVEVKATSVSIEGSSQWMRSAFKIEGKIVAIFFVQDGLRPEAKSTVAQLKSSNMDVWILSGDQGSTVNHVARELEVGSGFALSSMTPEDKAAWLENHPHTLYVGDGANDSLALKKASFGVAAHGALDISMKAGRAYLTRGSLQAVQDLFVVAGETRKILLRHFIFTVFYNGSTITLASMGMLKPLIAAVLMPLSSLIILISTQIGTKRLRSLK